MRPYWPSACRHSVNTPVAADMVAAAVAALVVGVVAAMHRWVAVAVEATAEALVVDLAELAAGAGLVGLAAVSVVDSAGLMRVLAAPD